MLILSREHKQRIVIGDTITITVLSVKKNRVQLGIEAPPAMPISRDKPAVAPAQIISDQK